MAEVCFNSRPNEVSRTDELKMQKTCEHEFFFPPIFIQKKKKERGVKFTSRKTPANGTWRLRDSSSLRVFKVQVATLVPA